MPTTASPCRPKAPPDTPAGPFCNTHIDTASDAVIDILNAAQQAVQPFSLVGVTWSDPRARLGSAVQIRVRAVAGHRWGLWTSLPTSDDAQDAGPVGRGGTAAVWVGASDGIEWRVGGVLAASLPRGMRLDLVDPGPSSPPVTPRTAPAAFVVPVDPSSPSAAASTSTSGSTVEQAPSTPGTAGLPTAPVITGTKPITGTSTIATPQPADTTVTRSRMPADDREPQMISRAGWGADESLRRAVPQYAAAVKAVFIHHTASSNGYTCSDSAAVVRGLYAYHTLGLGWNDIGYNFLVDRCGTLFEGRYGGAARPVIGAHTYGFNTGTAGIAVIGTFTSSAPAPEVLATLGRVAAWKLGLGGIAPDGTTTLVSGATEGRFAAGRSYRFDVLSGHRDGYATACPGAALYAQLPTLRSLAAGADRALGPMVAIPGAAVVDGRYVTTSQVSISWTPAPATWDVIGYTVLVDDAIAVTAGPAERSATLTLSPGIHQVVVRSTLRTPPLAPSTAPTTGSSSPPEQPPAGASASATVVVDTRPPVFAAGPAVGLRSGTVNPTGIPVALSWRARDDVGLAAVTVTSPSAARLGATSTTWATIAGPGVHRYAVTATDAAGNQASAVTTARTGLVPDTSAKRSGRWSRSLHSSHAGGVALSSATRGSALTWTFTGRGVGLVATRTRWSGQVRVYLDGLAVATVDLRASATSYRQAVWLRNGLTSGRHTITVVVLGTAKRPTVVTDGIVALS